MCGIAGYYLFDDCTQCYSTATLRKMTNSMKHRGPDDFGFLRCGKVALGHRRLSIIDLSSKGKQPMLDANKKVCISLNGEIYNFAELKNQLLAKGYKFKSKTDTEVILNAYLEHGIKCLHMLEGMFAFALYDKEKNKFYLARDRLGKKPLYYAIIKEGIVFGSEIKAILLFPKIKKEINLKAVSSYLSFRYTLGEETLFKGIKKLQPGYFLQAAGNKAETKQYWAVPCQKHQEDKGEKYYKQQIEYLLKTAVKKRLISDVPLGAFLSGGLDSSLLVALMSELSNSRVKTFSIGFKEKGFNELSYASMVAKYCNTEHKEIIVSSKNYFDTMRTLIRYKGLPLGVPNEIPLYLMSLKLKKDITVVLSGEGADELFMGYGRIFRSPFDFERLKLIQKLPMAAQKLLFKGLFEKYGEKKFSSQLEHFLYNYNYFPFDEKEKIFNEKMKATVNGDREIKELFGKTFDEAAGSSYYEKIQHVFEKIHLPGLLERLDNATMTAAVEARAPFVDYKLVEFMFSTPLKYKLAWKSPSSKTLAFFKSSDEISENLDTPKYILRKIAEKKLPKEIIKRKKEGFPVPLNEWFQKDFLDYAKDTLLAKNARIRAIIDQKALEKWMGNHLKSGTKKYGQWIWMLMSLEFWMREYFGKNRGQNNEL